MSNVESAAAAGDSYNLRSVLLADGSGAIIGAALGSPFPPAVYIGHPGWKAAGGRASYSMASGIFIAVLCFLGLFGVLNTLLPIPAIVPILLYIGLLIGAQAFQSVPRIQAAAVVAAILPNLASWGTGLIDNALAAAGTTAPQVGDGRPGQRRPGLRRPEDPRRGRGARRHGARLDRRLHPDAQVLRRGHRRRVGAVLSWIGLIHASEVAWAAQPEVALGYAMLGIVLVAFAFHRRNERAPAEAGGQRAGDGGLTPTARPAFGHSRAPVPTSGCGASASRPVPGRRLDRRAAHPTSARRPDPPRPPLAP